MNICLIRLLLLSERLEIVDQQKIDQKDDISRMMWFHVKAFRGIDFETHQVEQVIQKLFVADSIVAR